MKCEIKVEGKECGFDAEIEGNAKHILTVIVKSIKTLEKVEEEEE